MIVVSGCPRSGTSLMMELMRLTFGEDRILGAKFPQLARDVTRHPGDTDETFTFRQYMDALMDPEAEKRFAVSKDMNPNGFWEGPFAVQGAYYRPRLEGMLNTIEKEEVPSICKIVSQGLAKTDPRYVTKVVYMLREPDAVAKSQERLQREMVYRNSEGKRMNFWEGMDTISPQMFIDVSLRASRWIAMHPDIAVHYVKYSELMAEPKNTLRGIQCFLGEGDFTDAVAVINPKLNRSSRTKIMHPLLDNAFEVYEKMCEGDWEGLQCFGNDRAKLTHRQTWQWQCARSQQTTQEAICKDCQSKPAFRAQLIHLANVNKIDWINRPCAFECAFDVERTEYLSIEESVTHNHWKE